MGWWGEGVQDGDTPLDMQYDIRIAVGIDHGDEDDEREVELTEEEAKVRFLADREKLRAYPWKDLLNLGWQDHQCTWLHTIGFMYLEHQLTMPEELQQLVLRACDEDLENTTGWREPEERIKAVQQFKACVEKQDGGGLVFGSLFYSFSLHSRTLWD